MVKKKTSGLRRKPQIITTIIVILLSFIFIYPFWHLGVISFSDKISAQVPGFKFWPKVFSLEAYEYIFSQDRILTAYKNTIIRTVSGTLLTLILTFSASYALTRKELPGWSFLNIMITFTMFFGGGTIPTYLCLKKMGLMNTYWVLILPGACGAWNMIIMRNFLASVGRELEEAASIDGAGVIQTMIQIILPLSKAILAVIGLWSVVGHWNAYYDSMVYTPNGNMITLQLLIQRMTEQSKRQQITDMESMASITPMTIQASTVMVATIPILLGYPFIQKYLVKGVMVGSLKG